MTHKEDISAELKCTTPNWLDRLAVWKIQLLALAGAPFIGVGFVFDFSLRAKDFPELASAIWGVMGLFMGVFTFAVTLLLSGMLAAILGTHEARHRSAAGWERLLAVWAPRTLVALGIFSFLVVGYYSFVRSTDGFSSFVGPYVTWLRAVAP